MSPLDHDEPTTGIDPLQDLGKQLPWDRPDASRREAVRSSLLVAASDSPPRRAGRAVLVGAGFVTGALAAAAVALLLVRSPAPTATHENYAQIESSSVAELEHTSTLTSSGSDEVVRIRAGKVRLAVPATRAGDRVRTKTGDAEIEGTGAYEVVVANDKLSSVAVSSGTAKVIVDGKTVILASGETWSAPVLTADLSPQTPDRGTDGIAPTIGIEPTTGIEPPAGIAPKSANPVVDAQGPTPSWVRDVPSNVGEINQSTESIATTTRPATSTSVTGSHGTRSTVPAPTVIDTSAPSATTPSATTRPSVTTPSITTRPSITTTPSITTPPSTATTPTPPQPSITTNTTPSIATKPTSSSEQHFQAGWALLRDNKYSAAADELAIAAAGDGPLASDARYFQAVALTKAGRAKEAEGALVAFLDGAPTSTKRGRASVMLGRLLIARGDTKSARAWFTAALGDPDASVAGAAKAELAKVRP